MTAIGLEFAHTRLADEINCRYPKAGRGKQRDA